MRKRTLKQKCLAWLLSLAVAVTFIPLTAGFAFAEGETDVDLGTETTEPDMFINLAKANGSSFENNEVKVYVNLEAPWQDGDTIVAAQVATGEAMKPVITNINCKWAGSFDFGTEAFDKYFSVDYGEGNWTDPGTYTLTISANEEAEPFEATMKGTKHIVKVTGQYKLQCRIVDGAHDLASSTVTFSEGTVNKKTGEIEIPYDGKFHKLVPKEVKDNDGNVIDPDYYEVTYPASTTNAYKKVGPFDIVITAKEDNEGGYIGSITKTVSITDVVTDITVYSQNGKNGARQQAKMFKYAKWGNYSLTNPLVWGYGKNEWTTTSYIPVETLLSEAGLGEIGKFEDKDLIDIWTNSDPEHYFNAPKTVAELKTFKYAADENSSEVLNIFGGEYSIPAFLVLDCDNNSVNPRGAVGATEQGSKPQGNMSPSAVSEIALVSMDIEGLNPTVANATYTGKALEPKVTVNDGDEAVPVDVAYSNNTNAGTATAKITAKDDSAYYGTVTKTFKINKAANPVTVKAKTAKVKKSKVKKKAQKLAASKVMTVSKQQGKLTYAKVSGSKKLTITEAGKVTVKKKTKKGTYKMRVKVTAAGNANYKAGSKTVTVKVRVK